MFSLTLPQELTFLKDIFLTHAGSSHGLCLDDLDVKALLREDDEDNENEDSNDKDDDDEDSSEMVREEHFRLGLISVHAGTIYEEHVLRDSFLRLVKFMG